MSDQTQNKSSFSESVKKIGIFSAIILIMFCLLVLISFVGKNSWRTHLASNIQTVLSENDETDYEVGKYIPVNSPLSSNAAIYELDKTSSIHDGSYYAVIIKVTTMYGPLPAVYIYEKNTGAHFVDFYLAEGKVKEQILQSARNSQIAYWAKRIPDIVEDSAYGGR